MHWWLQTAGSIKCADYFQGYTWISKKTLKSLMHRDAAWRAFFQQSVQLSRALPKYKVQGLGRSTLIDHWATSNKRFLVYSLVKNVFTLSKWTDLNVLIP